MQNDLNSLWDRPAPYKIQAQGEAGNILLGDIDGMEYEVTDGGDAPSTMVFTGVLANQTALNSILKSLFNRNFVLLCVRRLD